MSMVVLGGCGRSAVEQEPVSDPVVKAELEALAEENLKAYFDIEVDYSKVMKTEVIRHVPKEGFEDQVSEVLMLTAQREEAPKEGELYSYGIVVDSETKDIRGLFSSTYNTSKPQEMTDEEVEAIAQRFIVDHKMVKEGTTPRLVQTENSRQANYIKVLTYECGEEYLMINVNLQDGQVMCFEYSL